MFLNDLMLYFIWNIKAILSRIVVGRTLNSSIKKISKSGVYCPEEIIPCEPFFKELEKRNINIKKEIKSKDEK